MLILRVLDVVGCGRCLAGDGAGAASAPLGDEAAGVEFGRGCAAAAADCAPGLAWTVASRSEPASGRRGGASGSAPEQSCVMPGTNAISPHPRRRGAAGAGLGAAGAGRRRAAEGCAADGRAERCAAVRERGAACGDGGRQGRRRTAGVAAGVGRLGPPPHRRRASRRGRRCGLRDAGADRRAAGSCPPSVNRRPCRASPGSRPEPSNSGVKYPTTIELASPKMMLRSSARPKPSGCSLALPRPDADPGRACRSIRRPPASAV